MPMSARKRMETAYFKLLQTEHYSKITVSNVIEQAGVSRTTFYRHYVDIFDMHEKVADRFAASIIEECFKKIITKKKDEDYFDVVLNIFNSQEKYIWLIAGKNGSRYFFEALFRIATQGVLPRLVNFSEEQMFRLRFMTLAAIGLYVKDMIDEREHSLEFIELCKKILNLDKVTVIKDEKQG